MDPTTVTDLANAGAWLPLAAILIWSIVRLLKSDTKLPVDLPDKFRAPLTAFLGLVAGILQHVASGIPWVPAIVGGLASGVLALTAQSVIPVPALVLKPVEPKAEDPS